METLVSRSIIQSYFTKLLSTLNVDCAIAGGGPSGLVAATRLAERGLRTVVLEPHLAPGGGMWGGAMLFNQVFVQKDAGHLMNEFGIHCEPVENGAVVADSIHATAALIYRASQAGAVILNGISVEDVVFLDDRVCGVVVNWSMIHRENLPVDPLVIRARAVIDGSGHPCEIADIVARKNGIRLNTTTGRVMGERSLAVEAGERTTIENTGEIYPGLYVCGMAANGVSGSFRMGPIFGGMLLSGVKVAQQILEDLQHDG